jgi:L-ascorbate metabolism protein UlaG (beta-lactamase superfamily)
MHIAFAGHSTVLVELDGVRVLTDPMFRSHLLHLRRHAPPIDLGVYGRADILLISHSHLDHLDRRSIKLLRKDLRAIVPNDSVNYMRAHGFTNVTGMSEGDTLEVDGLKIEAVHALHGGKRLPWQDWAETLGYVVTGSQSFYFAGDTDLFDGMADLGPNLDLALIPVWGWGPKLGHGHLDPERAAKAVEIIRPRVTTPIHWGGYMTAALASKQPQLLTEPPREFRRLVEELGIETRVELIEPGGSANVDRR